MTAMAEHVLQEIKTLPPADLRQVWARVSHRLAELNLPPGTPPAEVSDEEFQGALDELTGGTAGNNLTDLLLAERRRDREREQAEVEFHSETRL